MTATPPPAPPREVTEAMVDQALDAFWIGIDWRSPTPATAVSQRQKMHAALTAVLNASARTASDLNIERQVAGLDDIDRDDAAKWRAVSEECEKAGCCVLNAPARVEENALPMDATTAMLKAAQDWSREKYGKPIGNDDAGQCWHIMARAAAAPAPAAARERGVG